MPRKMGSATLGFGMVKIPFGIAKASSEESPDLKSLCECGGQLGYVCVDEDGNQVPPDAETANKIACKECLTSYPWWNSAPRKGYEIGDDVVPLNADAIDRARQEAPVELGNVEKVVNVKAVLRWYAIEGNYYLLPEDDHEDQYGVLVGCLNEQDWAILTYLQLRTKTKRYAIISENGVLIAVQLQDKKALPTLDYGTDEAMEEQAAQMLSGMVEDDPDLPDVEGQNLKEMIRDEMGGFEDEQEQAADAEAIVKGV